MQTEVKASPAENIANDIDEIRNALWCIDDHETRVDGLEALRRLEKQLTEKQEAAPAA